MKNIWFSIKHWYWWNFKATEKVFSRKDEWKQMKISGIDLMDEPLYFSKKAKILRKLLNRDEYFQIGGKMPSEYKIIENTDFSYTVYYKY